MKSDLEGEIRSGLQYLTQISEEGLEYHMGRLTEAEQRELVRMVHKLLPGEKEQGGTR